MPNSEAQSRIKKYDSWFQAKRNRKTAFEMKRELAIGDRQFCKDLAFMKEEFGAPICNPKRSEGYVYYYEDEFTIYNQLTEDNISSIKTALDVLRNFNGLPQFGFMDEVVEKLTPGSTLGVDSRQIVYFEEIINETVADNYSRIFLAIQQKRVLSLKYKAFNDEKIQTYTIHPYILKQYNTRWYLFGRCEEEPQYFPINLPLDRIIKRSIKILKEEYVENAIDWSSYFDDIIGVTKYRDKEPIDLVLHFYGLTGKYIETKPLHPNQLNPKWIDENTLEVKLKVIPNFELEKLILSFGENVKIIEPTNLCDSLKKRLDNAIGLY